MKLWIYIAFTFFLLACQKEEVPGYNQEKDSAYFVGINPSVSYNFADQMGKKDGLPWYPGDVLQTDTLLIEVRVLGYAVDYDRELYFNTIPLEDQDTSRMVTLEVLEPHIIAANRLKDTVYVVFHRPQERQTEYAGGLTFDVGKSEFAASLYGQNCVEFHISDIFTKPGDWDSFYMTYLGEWGPDKHLFVRTVFNSLNLPAANVGPWKGMFYPRVKRAYDDYNAAHPDNQLNFTIPVL